MPNRDNQLPEGTDHIINGAMETGGTTSAGLGASTGSSGGLGGSDPGFIGGDAGFGDATGGTATGGGGGLGGQGGSVANQLKGGASSLKQQATDKVRTLADDGKSRATDALDEFSRVVGEAASSIDERLGAEYGAYARRAADAVSGFATSLREKEVDEIYDGARELVRKSPVVAIGTAAAVGFALVRLIKSGLPDEQRDVDFQPDPALGQSQAPAAGSTTGTGA